MEYLPLTDYENSVVSDVSMTTAGLIAALVSILASCGQQIGVAFLTKKYSLTSTELVGEVFYLQV